MRASRVGLSLVVEATTQRRPCGAGCGPHGPTRPPLTAFSHQSPFVNVSIRAPPALLSSSVHLALSGLCIPGPQDAHSVHPQPQCLGWVRSTPRLFITTRRLHIHGGAAAQAGNRLLLQLSCSNQWSVTQALPQSSGRAAQPFQAVDAGC